MRIGGAFAMRMPGGFAMRNGGVFVMQTPGGIHANTHELDSSRVLVAV